MTTFAAPPETERLLAEIDAGVRDAWRAYRDDLRERAGSDYDEAEAAAWEQLQSTLRALDSARASLAPPPPQA